MIAAHRLGWRGRVRLGLDNAGVTARMEGKSEKGKRWLDEEVAEMVALKVEVVKAVCEGESLLLAFG